MIEMQPKPLVNSLQTWRRHHCVLGANLDAGPDARARRVGMPGNEAEGFGVNHILHV
jgi:hypothetical protein